ncbi:MAG TPA: hypothetical protein VMG10_10755 [Gemmataceae bacterium]|nr:hypothetical protein [Gemmataceae bacterium]
MSLPARCKNCPKLANLRGLCRTCCNRVAKMVEHGETTWAALEAAQLHAHMDRLDHILCDLPRMCARLSTISCADSLARTWPRSGH